MLFQYIFNIPCEPCLKIYMHIYFRDDEPIVIATARGMFDHRGGLLESAETNVSIYIPAGALPEGRKQEVYFKVCQDSKYMPPLDSRSGKFILVSLMCQLYFSLCLFIAVDFWFDVPAVRLPCLIIAVDF